MYHETQYLSKTKDVSYRRELPNLDHFIIFLLYINIAER
jgi:hypothetical protein